MKKKIVRISLSFDPAEYRLKRTAANACRLAALCMLGGGTDWPQGARVRIQCGKVIKYVTPNRP